MSWHYNFCEDVSVQYEVYPGLGSMQSFQITVNPEFLVTPGLCSADQSLSHRHVTLQPLSRKLYRKCDDSHELLVLYWAGHAHMPTQKFYICQENKNGWKIMSFNKLVSCSLIE